LLNRTKAYHKRKQNKFRRIYAEKHAQTKIHKRK
jgi:hypothetical protein